MTTKRDHIMERLVAAWEAWQGDHDDARYIARVRRILHGAPPKRPRMHAASTARLPWGHT
jgi:hypothetical protein